MLIEAQAHEDIFDINGFLRIVYMFAHAVVRGPLGIYNECFYDNITGETIGLVKYFLMLDNYKDLPAYNNEGKNPESFTVSSFGAVVEAVMAAMIFTASLKSPHLDIN